MGSIPACAGEPKLSDNPSTVSHGGSIPACAGEPLLDHRAYGLGWSVYPRVCGGTFGDFRAAKHVGLSPRVQGNPVSAVKTGVYPRVCGGTVLTQPELESHVINGLSPRVRGNRSEHAYGTITVYPRVCGGTGRNESYRNAIPDYGLSPRVRGNLVRPNPIIRPVGSIPACAGEPRSWTPACRMSAFGLSPRVRGNLLVVAHTVRVGEPKPVYPRVCGGTGLCCRGRFEPPVCGGTEEELREYQVYPRVCGGTTTMAQAL